MKRISFEELIGIGLVVLSGFLLADLSWRTFLGIWLLTVGVFIQHLRRNH